MEVDVCGVTEAVGDYAEAGESVWCYPVWNDVGCFCGGPGGEEGVSGHG